MASPVGSPAWRLWLFLQTSGPPPSRPSALVFVLSHRLAFQDRRCAFPPVDPDLRGLGPTAGGRVSFGGLETAGFAFAPYVLLVGCFDSFECPVEVLLHRVAISQQ